MTDISDMSNVLYIDLTEKTFEKVSRKDLYRKYLGGTGVATALFFEEFKDGMDPLDPRAPVVFSIGPLSALFPSCSKVVSMFRSPLTNELGESHAGGRLALAMRFSGCDSIVIKGRAKKPVYISIHDDEVLFKDASSIWGLSSTTDVGKIIREVEPGAGRRSIIRIGIAGEKLVKYSNVNVDTYRHFGRLGLGAVFGSKNLKAIVISGNKEIEVSDKKAYNLTFKQIYEEIVKTDQMHKYHDLGTTENILPLNEIKGLPTKNFQHSSFEFSESISGELFAEKYLIKRVSCAVCPIGCVHIAMLKKRFSRLHEYEIKNISYDYEPVYSMGTILGVQSPEGILELIDKCEMYGLDVISTGVVLAWATEMFQLDRIPESEKGGLNLRWSDVDSYLQAIDLIVGGTTDFYSAMGKGINYAAKEYGGEDFAMQIGGLEVAGYHTGPANIAGLAVGVRHSHLDNAGYSIDQKSLKKRLGEEDIADLLIYEDNIRSIFNSLTICLFARSVYSPDTIKAALGSLGIHADEETLNSLGNDIVMKKYELKKEWALTLKIFVFRKDSLKPYHLPELLTGTV